jgi:hypothetical protein
LDILLRSSLLTFLRIVAIHGLNGHPFRTWEKDDIIWFAQFVPEYLPDFNQRISSFGYNSRVAFGSSSFRIRDYAMQLLSQLHLKRKHVRRVWGTHLMLLTTVLRPNPLAYRSSSFATALGALFSKKSVHLLHVTSSHYLF